jgi:uncharacterized protein
MVNAHACRRGVVRWLLALPMLLGLGVAALGAEVAIPPSPTRWATDTTGFLDARTVAALDARLEAYQGSTGHQVLVYVAPTTGDTPTEDWTVRAFARWKVGRKGLDDGLVLFVFPRDHKVRIEVGYGLEQTVPDATAARIIGDITPKLKAGDPDNAVTAGVDEILGAIGGVPQVKSDDAAGKGDVAPRAPPAPRADPYDTSTSNGSDALGVVLGVLISLLVIVGIIVLIGKLPDPKGTYISSSSDGWGLAGMVLGGVLGAVTSGGGGFSGGGGMSGGGGATGSW